MNDINKSKELYGLYVQRFGNCQRTPYQAEYYKKWLELLDNCSSNEEAEERSKENGLYTAGATAVAKDRIFANKQAALQMGWSDVVELCDELLQKIEEDPYYTFTNSGLWAKLQAKKDGWLRTIEGFHRLYKEFVEYNDKRSEPQKYLPNIAESVKMLSKPSSDFTKLAALPSFRALIECSDEYYKEFTETIGKAISTGTLDSIQWSVEAHKDEIEELWNKKETLFEECKQWYSQPVKPVCLRLSPETADGEYKLIDIE